MSEQPAAVFGALLAAAVLLATVVFLGLVSLGGASIVDLAMIVLGAFSACVYFLTELDQVPLLSVVLVGLALSSTVALIRVLLGYWRQRRIFTRLPLEPIDREFSEFVGARSVVRLYRTPAERPAAFCCGLARPIIIVTDGLIAQLNPHEQAAAIAHEAEHARTREPLRCLIARMAAASFFWMPILADLLERYLLVKELVADREAVTRTSSRAVAGALDKVLGTPTPAGAVGLGERVPPRIGRLRDPSTPLPPLWTPKRLALSGVSGIILSLTIAFPARLDVSQAAHLRPMLMSMSVHGLPGMAAGLVINLAVITATIVTARRLRSRSRH